MNWLYPFRFLLYPLALLYGLLVWLRNRLYDSGFSSSVRFSVPVIAVGNLSVGGTGKTPHVEYLVRLLQYQFTVATMSRGYKRRSRGFLLADSENASALHLGDEPMQYFTKFPELRVSVAEDRVMGIPELLRKDPSVDVIILDDAFQHRSVKPGLNILITEWSRPYSTDFVLPLGRLREGRASAKRADVIVVSKCPEDLSREDAHRLEQKLQRRPDTPVYFTTLRYGTPYDILSGEPAALEPQTHVLLVCGIARPAPLETFLRSVAADVHVLSYPDHHFFSNANLEEIQAAYSNWEVARKIIVTTEKDAARLQFHREKLQAWNIPVMVLPIEVIFLFGGDSNFNAQVDGYVCNTIAENNM